MNDQPPENPPSNSVPPTVPQPSKPSAWKRFIKMLGQVGVALVFVAKLIGKVKFLLLPIIKFGLPVLKTGGTMLLSIWFYTMTWGWKFAVGFVLLIFVHECGHLIVARRFGLNVGAP